MTEDELVAHLNNEIESSTGNFNTELSAQREENMEYYLGEKFGNEIDGRSEIVTTDVRDTVEYIMPSLMRILTIQQSLNLKALKMLRWHNKQQSMLIMFLTNKTMDLKFYTMLSKMR